MEYKIEGIGLRNDNGSQCIAGVAGQFLNDISVNQKLTHVATPVDNAHIEALHSNVQREVVERFLFKSIYHAQMIFNCYYDWYNNHRKLSAVGRTPWKITSAKITLYTVPINLNKTPILSQILTPF
jgi:hypothetical protein